MTSLAAVAAATVCLAAPVSAFAYEPRVTDQFFGVSHPELWDMVVSARYPQRDSQLDGIKAAGIDWVRSELGWREIEPQAPSGSTHAYEWTQADNQVAAFAQRGLQLFPVLMGTPAWAEDPGSSAAGCGRRSGVRDGRASDFGAFAAAVTRRYGTAGSFWQAHPTLPYLPITRIEIWNEANWSGFWCPEPNPEAYASVLHAAAGGITAEDPTVDVVVGASAALQQSTLSGDRVRGMATDEFLRRTLASAPAVRELIDGVAFHPYDLDPAMNLSLIGWLRRELERLSLPDAEIVLTEFGWQSGGLLQGVITESLRAANYRELGSTLARTDCNITGVAAHSWSSSELDLLNPDHWWGISSPLTGLLYQSGQAYRDVIALFEGRGPEPAPRSTVTVCGSDEPPDQDGDEVPDADDDYPTDPERSEGSGEIPPEPDEEEPRLSPQRVHDGFYGATVVQLPDDFTRLSGEYAAMSSARIGRVRQRIEWSRIEPVAPGDAAYSTRSGWQWLDRIMLKMSTERIGFLPSFGSRPQWSPLAGVGLESAYAGLMTRYAQRYGPGGSFWEQNQNLDPDLALREYEVWQYANHDGHAPDGSASAAEYASLYAAARTALRTVDPSARALASVSELGHAGDAASFIREMVASRPALAGALDGAVVMTDYARTASAADAVVRSVRAALNETGNASAPIYLVFGAPTGGPEAISEAQRAQLFADIADRAPRADCGVEGLFPHAWTTPEEEAGNSWHWFGIADPDDATLTPTAEAYRDTASRYLGYEPTEATRAAVHPCDAPPPDRDGDGVPDAAESQPLDPASALPEASGPGQATIESMPASPTKATTAAFTYSAAGALSFQCKLDAGPYASCPSAGVSYSGLSHGQHQLTVRPVDALGLVGATASRTWTVDSRPPSVQMTTSPPVTVLTDTARFEFVADEEGASFWCQLDGNPLGSCQSPVEHRNLGDGYHEFQALAVDAVGNIGQRTKVSFHVRTTPLAPAITGGPEPGGGAGPTPSFAFSGDYAVNYQCRFDGAGFAACSGSASHQPSAALSDGSHSFDVRGVGGTGRTGPVTSRTFSVDASPPMVSIRMVRRKQGGRTTTFELVVADASPVESLDCKLDSKRWKACGSPHTVRRLSRGQHTLTVSATDRWGSRGEASRRWRVRR